MQETGGQDSLEKRGWQEPSAQPPLIPWAAPYSGTKP